MNVTVGGKIVFHCYDVDLPYFLFVKVIEETNKGYMML